MDKILMKSCKIQGYMTVQAVLAIIVYMMLANGLFTIFSSSFATLGAADVAIQAQQYAELDASLIKLVAYDDLDDEAALNEANLHFSRAAIKAVDAAGWEDEISISEEKIVNEDSESKYRIATVKIYKEGDTLARYSLQVPLSSQGTGTGGVPIGTVIAWPSYDLPAGADKDKWLECNGQSVDAAKYPKLAAMMTRTPDYQGVFLRGYGSQYSYHYGTVLHSSAAIGELQGDAIRNITGQIRATDNMDASYLANGAFSAQNVGDGDSGNERPELKIFTFDASRVVPTASENRPINKSVKYLIKAE